MKPEGIAIPSGFVVSCRWQDAEKISLSPPPAPARRDALFTEHRSRIAPKNRET
jgi:hypothetical protein